MAKNILVSVVINNYNYAKYVREAIESALHQTYPYVEIIVVDDGSTDDSRKIITEYEKAGKIKAVMKNNGGQASAFNAGFAVARGEAILFLDADDKLHPSALNVAVSALDEDVSKVQFKMRYINEKSIPLGGHHPKYVPRSFDARRFLIKYGQYPTPPTSGNLWSRRFLEKVLPLEEESWRIAADGYLITLAPFYGRVAHVNRILGFYRIHAENNYRNASLSTKRIIRVLQYELQKCKLLEMHLPEEMSNDLCTKNIVFLKHEIALRKLSKYNINLLSKRSLLAVSLRGICTSLIIPWYPLKSKIVHVCFFLLVPLMPRSVSKRIIEWALLPVSRPSWFK